jgi:signal transduction histidine kinase
MARRLMMLQRQQLTESQVLDRRARRLLHDDVLPQLHAAMLSLRSGATTPPDLQAEAVELLGDVHHQISNLLRDLPASLTPEVTHLGLPGALRWVIEREMKGAFDQVDWNIDPQAEQSAGGLPPLATEVAFYAAREAIRNAARHARPEGSMEPLRLWITMTLQPDGLDIRIEDNGVGLNSQATSSSGSGAGLALHSSLLAVVGGSLVIESKRDEYTCVRIYLLKSLWSSGSTSSA